MTLETILRTAAPVQLYDETDGIFGELIHPELVVSSLRRHAVADDLVGRVDLGDGGDSGAPPHVEIRSQTYAPTTYRDGGGKDVTTDEVVVEVDNTSNLPVRVRWVDANWSNPPTHVWTVEPSSTWMQFAKAGHLFVLSVLADGTRDLFDTSSEAVIGAFRPTRRLPSGSSHCLLVQGEGGASASSSSSSPLVLEVMLMDETKLDALCVAASALDHEIASSRVRALDTVSTLNKVVSNVAKHPGLDKYRRLRLSNPKIERTISSSMGAMDFLHVLGFRETEITSTNESDGAREEKAVVSETFLVLPEPSGNTIDRFKMAVEILGLLSQHTDPKYSSELSAPVPWQTASRASGAGRSNWNTEGTHFMTGDERWERVERARRLRRSGGGRPPAPGNAPSSRGRWGR